MKTLLYALAATLPLALSAPAVAQSQHGHDHGQPPAASAPMMPGMMNHQGMDHQAMMEHMQGMMQNMQGMMKQMQGGMAGGGMMPGTMMAQGTMDHSAMGHGAMSTPKGDGGPSSKAFAEANAKMHAGMDIEFSGDADVDFVRGMIAHHEGAIDMAKILLQYGKDPELRTLAEGIISAQETEVAMMKAWLTAKGLE